MNVLHIIGGIAKGGGGPTELIFKLCKEIKKLGVKLTVYTSNADYGKDMSVPLYTPTTYDGIPMRFYRVLRMKKKATYGWSTGLIYDLPKFMLQFDLIHIHSLFIFPTLISAKYSSFFGIPYIIRPHGSLMPEALKMGKSKLKRFYLNLIEKSNIENASAIHFTTEIEKEKSMSLGLKIKRAVVVPNGIDPEDFREFPLPGQFREKYPELKNKTVILFLGRIAHEKGLDTLIPAFAQVVKKRKGVCLILAGPDYEGYGKKVKRWIMDYGIDDKVIFTGPVYGMDKLGVLQDSDIFVLPSYFENYGISAVEAMYSKLPVIITDNVGIHREVNQAGAGLVVQKDTEMLCDAIITLVENKDLRRRMGENGRRLVEEKFTCEKVAKQMVEVYKEILNERKK
jgi:glycosyltransferase involved in cell wall biosynthesis